MTKLEWEMLLELTNCTFAPATFDKRFVRSMKERGKIYQLSEKQRGVLWQLHYKYRKQILGMRLKVQSGLFRRFRDACER